MPMHRLLGSSRHGPGRAQLLAAILVVFGAAILSTATHAGPSGGGTLAPEADTGTCSLTYLDVSRVDALDSPSDGSYTEAQKIVEHITSYSGSTRMAATPRRAAAELENPANLPLAHARRHAFSCWDGRAENALIGTPGGDLAEFLLGLNALEHLRAVSEAFTQSHVDAYFQNFLSLRDEFYIHMSEAAFANWTQLAKIEDPLRPNSPAEEERSLAWAVRFMDCDHIRNMMENEAAYGCRRLLTEAVIKAVLKVKMDSSNRNSAKIIFVKEKGYLHDEGAFVNILSPDSSDPVGDRSQNRGCDYITPLVVPKIGSTSIMVYHPRAVYEYRALIASYLQEAEGRGPEFRDQLFTLMCKIGNHQMQLSKAIGASRIPTYVAQFRTGTFPGIPGAASQSEAPLPSNSNQ